MRKGSLAGPNDIFANCFVYLLRPRLLLDEWASLNQQVQEIVENELSR